MSRSTGVVGSYSTKTGYGFITDSDSGENVFVHQNDIDMEGFRHLNIGDEVEYDVVNAERGFKAENVSVTNQSKIKSKPKPVRPRIDDNHEVSKEVAHVKSELRKMQKSFEKLINILNSGDDPILIDDEVSQITGKK